jgi:hypothetical protein
MSSANDYTRLGVIHLDTKHDYTAFMKYCQDEKNWFKRARQREAAAYAATVMLGGKITE